MIYADLRDFIDQLERLGKLVRVPETVSPRLEMTAVSDAVLRSGGPALLFEKPDGYNIPCLTNLFGTPERVALGMGSESVGELRDIGRMLASLKEPEPPRGMKDAGKLLHMAKALWDMKPSLQRRAPCQEVIFEDDDVDLGGLPLQTCWPGDAGPLITWGLVVTRGPQSVATPRLRQNLGIYRQQLIGPRQRHHALAGASRRRAGFPRIRPGQPGPALPDRGGAGRRPGHDPGRCDAGSRLAVGVPVRRSAARPPHGAGPQQRRRRATFSCRFRPVPKSCSRATSRPRRRACAAAASWAWNCASRAAICMHWKAPSVTIPATTTSRTGSRCSRSRA